MAGEKHSFPTPEGRAFWWTEGLWVAAAGLPRRRVLIADIPEVDLDCWFGPTAPATVRAVAEHARRIRDADRSHPVILAADGHLMDGGHRIAQALLAGEEYVDAVRLDPTPPPDWIDTDHPTTADPAENHR